MRLGCLFLMSVFLLGCGSQQQTGNLDQCTGQVTIKDQMYDVNNGGTIQYIGATTQMGQYIQFRQSMTINQIMIKAFMSSLTSVKVSLYKSNTSDNFPTDATLIKEVTVTEGLIPDTTTWEMWMVLPEPFEVTAITDEEASAGNYYFVALELNGSMGHYYTTNHKPSRWRKGMRWGSGNTNWHANNTNLAIDMGFRGESNCQSTSN